MRLVRADVIPSMGASPTRVKSGGVGGALKSSSSFESLRLELICFSSFSVLTADAEVLVKVAAPLLGHDCKVRSLDPPALSPYKQEVMQCDITAPLHTHSLYTIVSSYLLFACNQLPVLLWWQLSFFFLLFITCHPSQGRLTMTLKKNSDLYGCVYEVKD